MNIVVGVKILGTKYCTGDYVKCGCTHPVFRWWALTCTDMFYVSFAFLYIACVGIGQQNVLLN